MTKLMTISTLANVVLAAVCVLVFTGDAEASQWKGREVEREGTLHIINPKTPIEPVITAATEEIWRIGGSETEEYLVGPVGDVARDAAGNSYLLDYQQSLVHVVSPDGEYLRSIGREGEGPGEFHYGANVLLLADGMVCVLQVNPGRAVMLTPEGDAAGDLPLPRGEGDSHPFVNGGGIAKGELVVKLDEFIMRDESFALKTSFVRINPGGEIVTTYWGQLREQDMAKITFDEKADAEPVWAVGQDGRFYINNDWEHYTIEVYAPDGSLVHVIERDYEPRKRTARDLARIEKQKTAGEISPDTEASKTSRAVFRLFPRSDGTLWALSGKGARDVPNGTVATFDVFDTNGRFFRQISIRGPFRPGRDGFFLAGDCVYVVTNTGGLARVDAETMGEASGEDFNTIEVMCLRLDESGP